MARTWFALAVVVPRPLAAALSAALMDLGATGVQEDAPPGFTPRYRQPWDTGPGQRAPRRVTLRAWFAERPDDASLAAALAGRAVDTPNWTIEAEQDWAEAWKAHFEPVVISERLVVAAPWHDVPGALLIEPGNAFGTGEHITTRACLRAIDRLAVPGGSLLDVGCGSGILALAAAKLGMRAVGIDTDADAVDAANRAAVANHLVAEFSTMPLAAVRGTFDLVVANLYAEVLASLAPDLLRVAAGPIACAGILADRAHLVRTAFAARPILEDLTAEGWTSLVFGGP
jgi:ribosomal protein L11 methyltransferase